MAWGTSSSLVEHPTTELQPLPGSCWRPYHRNLWSPRVPRRCYTDALSNPVAHSEDQWPVSSALSTCSRKSPKFKGYYCGCHSEVPIAGCSWCCPVSFFPHHSQNKDDSNLGLKSKSIQGSYRKSPLGLGWKTTHHLYFALNLVHLLL